MKKDEHFLFFSEDISSDHVFLNETETKHIVSVLRLKKGEKIRITDGKGGVVVGEFDSVSGRTAGCRVTSRYREKRKYPSIILFVGIPDRPAFESICADATALGIDRIIPVITDHCRKPWWNTWENPAARLGTIMITALKQSRGLFLPILSSPCTFKQVFSECLPDMRMVADPAGKPIKMILSDTRITQAMACCVGPPGGFSEDEMHLLNGYSFVPVSVAPLRLRTELATISLCAQITGYLL